MKRSNKRNLISLFRDDPAVWILFAAFGLLGIQMAQAVSDLLTLLCAIPIHIHVMRTLAPEKPANR